MIKHLPLVFLSCLFLHCAHDSKEPTTILANSESPAIKPGHDVHAYAVELLAAFDDLEQTERFLASYAPDGFLQAGNTVPTVGRDNLRRAIRRLAEVAPITHHIKSAARTDQQIFISVDMTYRPVGQRPVNIPGVVLIDLDDDDRIVGMFVAMDRSQSHPLRDAPESL